MYVYALFNKRSLCFCCLLLSKIFGLSYSNTSRRSSILREFAFTSFFLLEKFLLRRIYIQIGNKVEPKAFFWKQMSASSIGERGDVLIDLPQTSFIVSVFLTSISSRRRLPLSSVVITNVMMSNATLYTRNTYHFYPPCLFHLNPTSLPQQRHH